MMGRPTTRSAQSRGGGRISGSNALKENSRPNTAPNENDAHAVAKRPTSSQQQKATVTSSNKGSSSAAPANEKEQKYETIEERGSGSTVIRRYLKGKLLGKGGFAKCYWATCLQTQKQYAMKVVLKSTLQKPKAKAKLQAEVKIHSMLRHHHVVYFSHFFEDANCYYMLLELCHNKSFSELMKRRKRLSEPEVQYYMTQILAALAYLHNINVIHRDLKLGNLLLDKDMCVKIGDLGLAAKVADSDERKRTLCGTPNYIAPEILENKHGHSFQVDIWSTGVVMYTLLVGRPPYESRDVKSTYKRILANNFTFPEHVHVSEAAKDLICRMLQTNPEKRPSIESINAHPFFTRRDALIPTSMPTSALVSPPVFGRSTSHPVAAVPPLKPSPPPSSSNAAPVLPSTGAAPVSALRDVAAVSVPHQPRSMKPPSCRSVAPANAPMRAAPRRTGDDNLAPSSSTEPRQKKEATGTDRTDQLGGIATAVVAARSDVQNSRDRRSTKHVESVDVNTNPLSTPAVASGAGLTEKVVTTDLPPRPSTAHSRHVSGRSDAALVNALPPSTTVAEHLGSVNAQSRPATADTAVARVHPTSAELKVKQPSTGSTGTRRRSGSIGGGASTKVSPTAEMGTLECIHHNLQQTMQTIESASKSGSTSSGNLVGPTLARSSSGAHSYCSPSLWVTQYVDYTSKYGLGYLFVDGSTGVYFNDSTKIILAAHGEHFQYMERVRSSEKGTSNKEMVGARPAERCEHHTLSEYPPSLHKKVTLLQHFRDYLLQQEKEKLERDPAHAARVGAHRALGREVVPGQPRAVWGENENDPNASLVYVKKWVRTRHAILFRLSNHTVQVMFLDNTEVILSSEARIITFADKAGNRRTYSVGEIVKEPRSDISKRLKYTKDILRQLISGSKR